MTDSSKPDPHRGLGERETKDFCDRSTRPCDVRTFQEQGQESTRPCSPSTLRLCIPGDTGASDVGGRTTTTLLLLLLLPRESSLSSTVAADRRRRQYRSVRTEFECVMQLHSPDDGGEEMSEGLPTDFVDSVIAESESDDLELCVRTMEFVDMVQEGGDESHQGSLEADDGGLRLRLLLLLLLLFDADFRWSSRFLGHSDRGRLGGCEGEKGIRVSRLHSGYTQVVDNTQKRTAKTVRRNDDDSEVVMAMGRISPLSPSSPLEEGLREIDVSDRCRPTPLQQEGLGRCREWDKGLESTGWTRVTVAGKPSA